MTKTAFALLLSRSLATASIPAGALMGTCTPCSSRLNLLDSSASIAEPMQPFAVGAATGTRPIHLAHAILVKALPNREAVITDVPEKVLLIFNDGIGQEFLALAVIDESGKRVDNHDAKLNSTGHSHPGLRWRN
jgi:hypothetical protein